MSYLKAILKYWWWLVTGMVGGILAVTSILGITVPITLPIGLLILFVSILVAQYLAYRDLQKEKHKSEAELRDIQNNKLSSQRIEIISKEKYPSEILRILDDMRRNLSMIIESSDKITDINPDKLLDSVRGITPHELYLAIHPQTVSDYVFIVYTFYLKFSLGIGLGDLQLNDEQWIKLLDEYESVKKDIPDQLLKEYVIAHYQALNGSAAVRLYYRYMRIHGAKEINVQAVEPFRPNSDLLDQTITRVTKRILELKLGEEPKWEMRYYKEK